MQARCSSSAVFRQRRGVSLAADGVGVQGILGVKKANTALALAQRNGSD